MQFSVRNPNKIVQFLDIPLSQVVFYLKVIIYKYKMVQLFNLTDFVRISDCPKCEQNRSDFRQCLKSELFQTKRDFRTPKSELFRFRPSTVQELYIFARFSNSPAFGHFPQSTPFHKKWSSLTKKDQNPSLEHPVLGHLTVLDIRNFFIKRSSLLPDCSVWISDSQN